MIELKLGKLPKEDDTRNLKLARYMPVPEAPEKVTWHNFKPVSDWGMKGNDEYGNCVIVTASHIIDCAQANESGIMRRLSDEAVVQLSTDMGALNGYYILRRLKHWRKCGMWGHYISAFVDIEPIEHKYLKAAAYLFGHVDIGLLMPRAWKNSTFWDSGTSPAYAKNSWGGHSVPLLGYYQHENYGLVYYAATWGRIVEITSAAINKYCDEAYVSILPDWFAMDHVSPSGFNEAQLKEDLTKLD